MNKFKRLIFCFDFRSTILDFLDKYPFLILENKLERVSVIIIECIFIIYQNKLNCIKLYYQLYFETPGKKASEANFLN